MFCVVFLFNCIHMCHVMGWEDDCLQNIELNIKTCITTTAAAAATATANMTFPMLLCFCLPIGEKGI